MILSRRKRRYYNRQNKRRINRQIRNQQTSCFEEVFSFHTLFKYGKKCCKGVRWKQSTQNFESHLFSRTAVCTQKMQDKRFQPLPYHKFKLNERGKIRDIDSPHINDRQPHKAFSQEVLRNLYIPELIKENGASIPQRGFHYTMDIVKQYLREHFKSYGRNGYIILIDFSKYFPNASHEYIKQTHIKYIQDNDLRNYADSVVDYLVTKSGMPLGIEPSQLEMVMYTTRLDTYVRCQMSLKMIHYMDDYILLVPPKRDPKELLNQFIRKSKELSLKLNVDKTQIIKFGSPFRWCKAKYILTDSGKVVIHGNPKSYKSAKKRIDKFLRLIIDGRVNFEHLREYMNSVLAYHDKYNDNRKIQKLVKKFYSVFGFNPRKVEEFRKLDEILKRGKNYMDRYICCKRFKEKCIVGDVNIPYNTNLVEMNGYICWGSKIICRVKSHQAHEYFGLNTDGSGLERNNLTHSIISNLNRSNVKHENDPTWSRLVNERWKVIYDDETCNRYRSKDIKDDWIWGHEFYAGPIKDLEYIWNLVKNCKVPEIKEDA